jgi:hypothetical protein
MELIFEKLSELKINESNLPVGLQKRIDALDANITSLNKSIDKMESDGVSEEEIEQRTSSVDQQIDREEQQIVAEITAWANANRNYQKQSPANNNTEKKSSNEGWLIFGAVAFVLTLGVVNVFKNR